MDLPGGWKGEGAQRGGGVLLGAEQLEAWPSLEDLGPTSMQRSSHPVESRLAFSEKQKCHPAVPHRSHVSCVLAAL